MTQGAGNNNVFPAFSGILVQSLGLQGLPGACPSNLAATDVEFGPATPCLPASIQSVDDALAWFEENVACLLNPSAIMAAPDGQILRWDATASMLVPTTIGAVLGAGLSGTSNNDVLIYNTLSSSYTPSSLLTWLATNLPGVLPDAFDAVFPCNNLGQLLGCTANGWAATSFLQAFNTGLPGQNNFDLVYFNAGTGSWATTDAGSVLGNNLPAALAAAYPCTSGDLISCVGGQWQSTTFQVAMNTGLPGTTASDIPVWNGSAWVPTEEQTWLATVLGPALGNQSLTALNDTPAVLGSPGQVLATNAASTGTIWTTPTASVTTLTGLTDTPNVLTPNTFLQVNPGGTGFNSVNICATLSSCTISSLQDVPAIGAPLQVLRVNQLGGAHEYVDICAAIAGCSITNFSDGPAALGTAGQVLIMNPAGDGTTFADFCTQLANCSLGALSDTPTALGTAGQVFTIDPTGNSAIWADITAGGALPFGAAGDLPVYATAGTTATPQTILEYLDQFHPVPATICNAHLTNDGSGWRVDEGIAPAPNSWTYPLAPQTVGLELEVNPATLCPEWAAPSHIAGTFNIPGDFPSVDEFVTWAAGRSVDVDLNVSSPQVAGIRINEQNAPSGHILIRANGNSVGEVDALSSAVALSIDGAEFDSIDVMAGQLAIINAVAINNTNGLGIFVRNNGKVRVSGDLTINGAGQSGIAIDSGGSIHADAGIVITGANTVAGIQVIGGSTFVVDGDLLTSNSLNDGVNIIGSSVNVRGNVTITNNARFGVSAGSVSAFTVAVTSGGMNISNNGSSGIISFASSAVTSFARGATTISGNRDGLNAENASSIQISGETVSIENSTRAGIFSRENGSVDIAGTNGVTIQNNTTGLLSEFSASIRAIGAGTSITGNTTGISAQFGSKLRLQGTIIAGNGTNTNIPVNTLSADGSYILN